MRAEIALEIRGDTGTLAIRGQSVVPVCCTDWSCLRENTGPLRHTLLLHGKSMHQVARVADQALCYANWKIAEPYGIATRGSAANTM